MHSGKNQFKQMIKEFDLAIIRAESGINDLTRLTSETTEKLHKAIEKAQMLSNDITFMNDMGSDIADRLEKTINQAQNVDKKLNKISEDLTAQANAVAPGKKDIETLLAKISANRNNSPSSEQPVYFKTMKNV